MQFDPGSGISTQFYSKSNSAVEQWTVKSILSDL